MDETTTTALLARQLEELHLLTFSLLPGESISFSPTFEDEETWTRLLQAYPEIDPATPLQSTSLRFEVRVEGSEIWFEVQFPEFRGAYSSSQPTVSVKGDNLARNEQVAVQENVAQLLQDLDDSEYITFDLISTHLLPLLHARAEEQRTIGRQETPSSRSVPSNERYHTLLTSHHLVSPTKRRNLHQWSSQLDISGFAKVGYPGIIYAEGPKDSVEDFVSRIKAMQWLALRMRFIEPVPNQEVAVPDSRAWTEFEKRRTRVHRRALRDAISAELVLNHGYIRKAILDCPEPIQPFRAFKQARPEEAKDRGSYGMAEHSVSMVHVYRCRLQTEIGGVFLLSRTVSRETISSHRMMGSRYVGAKHHAL
ncbi:hypothetical protein NM688_g2071 [Phlebia brevispora]|uniref:Uncharacterized protein n=1 Tax=Phlebia brevispora TaxID=194682 RepID=A0ACC1TAB1_9APHY|nr:hypothetical protein NM688_g2071 [Phlebia brevispora]